MQTLYEPAVSGFFYFYFPAFAESIVGAGALREWTSPRYPMFNSVLTLIILMEARLARL